MPNLITWQGAAISVQYLTRDGRSYRPAKAIEKADVLTFSLNGKSATLVKDKTIPLVNESDRRGQRAQQRAGSCRAQEPYFEHRMEI
jgi:hypothetical protein